MPQPVDGQWTNRYPKLAGYGHHVYLEGYELPTLTNGPIDPAPSPDGESIAFSARGWIWIMDLESGVARRVTSGGEMDFRPAWSPDGQRLAFVRDNDHDTYVVVMDQRSGEVLHEITSTGFDLDPAFSADGSRVIYSSSVEGSLDIWAFDLDAQTKERLTTEPTIELNPRPHPDGQRMLVLTKGRGGGDRVEVRSVAGTTAPRAVEVGNIASMARPALSPDGQTVALNWPTQSGWQLRIVDLEAPSSSILLVDGGLPLTPAWSSNGEWIYFAEADQDERTHLHRVRAAGGPVEAVAVREWDWGVETGRLRIRTGITGAPGPVPARLSVLGPTGHPAVPDQTAPHFDGQSGRVFFYSDGVVDITVPAGEVTVSAVQGLATPEEISTVAVGPGEVTSMDVRLTPLWTEAGGPWMSGEHHFHLNYGGQYDLTPSDLMLKMRGEALDVATPLLANLHDRFEDQDLWGWQKSDGVPFVRFGQEIRSHFLGHLGLIETPELHWPWIWGPGYQVYARDDRTNGEVFEFARRSGGLGYYVHPVSSSGNPFEGDGPARLPVEMIADGVMGDIDALEVVCLWSDEVGTMEFWYRLLNIGQTVAPSAGTDVMTNLYRTMAVGTTRVYAWTDGLENWPTYVEALRSGRSFVTTGPWLDFQVSDVRPGGVVEPGTATWSLDLRTATEVTDVEIVVNGEVVWSESGLDEPGARTYSGQVTLPSGGWIAARASGGETRWPSMDSYPFAHSSPIWIGNRGSTEPGARRAAAEELMGGLAVARNRLTIGYGGAEIPKLMARFDEAQARLEVLVRP